MDAGERNFLTGETCNVTPLNLENPRAKVKLEWRRVCSYFIKENHARITAAEVRLSVALLCLLRLHYGIPLFEHPAVGQREIGEKKHREKDPPSGKMEAQDEVRETVVAQNNK